MINSIINRLRSLLFNKKGKWKHFYTNVPKNIKYDTGSLVDSLLLSATMYPDNVAIIYYNVAITYTELMEKIKKAAKSLKSIGIKEGDMVTICMPNTPESVIMFYAINMVGAVANMIHPLSSEKEIEFFLNESKSKAILTIDVSFFKVASVLDNTSVEKVIVTSATKSMGFLVDACYFLFKGRKSVTKGDKIINWDSFMKLGKSYDQDFYIKRDANDLAVILYSGGTTGKPKGIMLSNLNFNAGAIQSRYMSDTMKPGGKFLTILPNFHAFGIGISTHTPLYNGMTCILVPKFDMKKFGKIIKRYHPNVIAGVPTLFDALTKIRLNKNDLSSLTLAVCGGDAISSDTKKKVNQFFKEHSSKTDLRCGYGLTECSGASCLAPEGTEKYTDIIGIPFPNCVYKIIDPNTKLELDCNEDGEICISGPNVMLGYLNDEVETKMALEKHDDGNIWLHTGDVGHIDKNGFLFFKSRIKRMYITNGYNVYPGYIEEVLKEHEAIKNAVVIGIPHPYKGQIGKAFIVLKDGYKPSMDTKMSINKHLKKNLANYMIPKEYVYVDSIPMTLVGKVSYKDLK